MAPPMSAFEAKRLANVASNQKLLEGTKEIGASMKRAVAPAPKPAKAAGTKKRKAASPAQPAEPTRKVRTRQSSRLAGETAASDDLKADQIPPELRLPHPIIKPNRISGELALSKIQVEGQRWASGDAATIFGRGAQPGVPTFTDDDDMKESVGDELKKIRITMKELELYPGWQPNDIKITPERVYSLTFHPMKDKAIVIAGDKTGVLGIFDASQEMPEYPEDDDDYRSPLPQVHAYNAHTRTISSLKAPIFEPNLVFTGSYDSSIRAVDLNAGKILELYAPEDESENLPITCIDTSPESKDIIYFSTMAGSVGRFDRRAGPELNLSNWSLTDNKIGGFALHPRLPHLLATASLDRTLKIWDTRMINGSGTPYKIGEHSSRLSVSHASWSRSGHLATSSYDDTVKLYDFSSASAWKRGKDLSDIEPSYAIPHNNQTGRWVTILKPQWQIQPADGVDKFAIANMNRFVDIYGNDGQQLAQLGGDGITAVPAVAELHPTHNWVAGGTGSGKLCLWM